MLQALGLTVHGAGVGLALLAAALIPPAVLLAARAAGASTRAALVAGIAALLWPDGAGFAQQLQPDSAIALGGVALAGLLAAAAGGSTRAAWGAACLAALLPLLREHGLPLAGIAALILLAVPHGRRAALGLLVLLWLAPLLVGVAPGLHPLDLPWGERPGGALAVLGRASVEDVPYARTLPPGPRATYLGLVERGEALGLVRFHAARALHLAWDAWLLGGAALLLALSTRRRPVIALALPLLAATPALLIWSQRRHVAVLVPVALAVLAAARPTSPALARARWPALALLALSLGLPWSAAWRALGPAQRTEVPRARAFASVAGWLAEQAPPGSLLGGVFQDIGIYIDLPRHDPDGSAADWKTFVVADRPPPDRAWEAVFSGAGGLVVYQLRPGLDPRPCAEARPAPGTPHLAVAAARARLVDAQADCLPPGEAAGPAAR